jgi:hypothetical protein
VTATERGFDCLLPSREKPDERGVYISGDENRMLARRFFIGLVMNPNAWAIRIFEWRSEADRDLEIFGPINPDC